MILLISRISLQIRRNSRHFTRFYAQLLANNNIWLKNSPKLPY